MPTPDHITPAQARDLSFRVHSMREPLNDAYLFKIIYSLGGKRRIIDHQHILRGRTNEHEEMVRGLVAVIAEDISIMLVTGFAKADLAKQLRSIP